MLPLAIDLFCGLGGWTDGLLAEGYYVVGFDIERHDYGDGKRYPAQLVIQDVRTIHGKQFKGAALIVASPPCQEYSYMAMPWSRAKAIAAEYRTGKRDVKDLTRLFNECFRIQREASEAAGHKVPMVVENVRGAQPWVGRAKWNFGSFYLWGDVPALMPIGHHRKLPPAISASIRAGKSPAHWTNPAEHYFDGMKQRGSGREWFAGEGKISRVTSSKSTARKAASTAIAKIPFALAQHIARVYRPTHGRAPRPTSFCDASASSPEPGADGSGREHTR